MSIGFCPQCGGRLTFPIDDASMKARCPGCRAIIAVSDCIDYYEVLQVTPNAEEEIIQAAYRRLAAKWHPDRRPGDEEGAQQMRLINEAYDVLTDQQRRRDF